MDIVIRQEEPADYPIIFDLIQKAFSTLEISDQTEHLLVDRLRQTDAYIPELSLVACYNKSIVGHIILTKIHIQTKQRTFKSLALAPVSVLPEMQGNGIGSKLIRTVHDIARSIGFESIVLIGHEDYYPRFGYELASTYGITFPFDVPEKNAFVIKFNPKPFSFDEGQVIYPEAFLG